VPLPVPHLRAGDGADHPDGAGGGAGHPAVHPGPHAADARHAGRAGRRVPGVLAAVRDLDAARVRRRGARRARGGRLPRRRLVGPHVPVGAAAAGGARARRHQRVLVHRGLERVHLRPDLHVRRGELHRGRRAASLLRPARHRLGRGHGRVHADHDPGGGVLRDRPEAAHRRPRRRRGEGVSADEALVNGVLLPGFLGTTVPEWLARALDAGLAGVCLFAQNVGPGLPELTARLHGRRAGVLVASDEEGGPVTRLDAPWPSAAALGRLDDVAATEAVGADVGARCRATGIDLALAPVADVNAEPDNPVIGIRSVGATPRLGARHVAAFVRGVQGAGTAATAKHFPGHGCTVLDSHLALPAVDDAADVVRARDLPPFAAAVEAGVRCVLTAHVRFGAFDDRPATMSPPLLALLRRELGFDGVVISDAVDMAAIAATVGTGAGAVAAVAAGVDLVCIGNPRNGYDDEAGYRRVRDALLAA